MKFALFLGLAVLIAFCYGKAIPSSIENLPMGQEQSSQPEIGQDHQSEVEGSRNQQKREQKEVTLIWPYFETKHI